MGCEAITSLWRNSLRWLVLAWYRRALAEIHPLHPDVPFIVHRINDLRTK